MERFGQPHRFGFSQTCASTNDKNARRFSQFRLVSRSRTYFQVRLADSFGPDELRFERPRNIRDLIYRHLSMLEEFGVIPTVGNVVRKGNRIVECLLDEGQAIHVATQSDAPKAREVKIAVSKFEVVLMSGRNTRVLTRHAGWAITIISLGLVMNKAMEHSLVTVKPGGD